MKKIAILFFALLLLNTANAEIKLAAILGDNMILQQQTNANLWGKATPRSDVSIRTSWNNRTYTTKANDKGEWIQAVETPNAGGPYEITFSDGTALTIKNILIGEVWLCSGQSNMEQPMSGYFGEPTYESTDLINLAHPERQIRIATVQKAWSRTPLEECKTAGWELNTPEVVARATAIGYFFANYVEKALDVPIGIIHSSWGGSTIETWLDKESFHAFPEFDLAFINQSGEVKNPNQPPTLLYNAMIDPIKKYTVKGVLWYQGESNRGRHSQYERLAERQINKWRELFSNPTMPFYFVQIAPYQYDDPNGWTSGYFYESQARIAANNPNTGMVVSVDTGEKECIHPAHKKEIAERLAYWALGDTYKLPIKYKSPTYISMEAKENKILLSFANNDQGMWSPIYNQIPGFEIAGEDKNFYPAKAKLISRGRVIEVESDQVPNPTAVRYCFRNYQVGQVFSNLGLPLAPFRTDNWDIEK